MACMVDWEIEKAIFDGEIKISPLDLSLINPSSMDIRLGKTYGFLRSTGKAIKDAFTDIIDPSNIDSFKTDYADYEEYRLYPREFILVSMFERVELSSKICAKLMGKSSMGRLGLINSSHAGWVDNNWRGTLTMELYNSGPHPILLKYGMKIGQLVFFKTEMPKKDYSMTGRYQNQLPGTGSKGV